jgi:hypothetical protein
MEADFQTFIALEDVEEREVAVLVRLLEHSVEVADRLMIVQDEHKAQRLIHSGVMGASAAGGFHVDSRGQCESYYICGFGTLGLAESLSDCAIAATLRCPEAGQLVQLRATTEPP